MTEMTEPAWLAALRSDEELVRRYGLNFLDEESVAKIRALAHQAWEGKFSGEFADEGHARIERSTPVAGGLLQKRRISGSEESLVLWLDPAEDALFAGFTLLYPPPLWLPLGGTRASVEAALAPYTVAEPAPVWSLPTVRRLLKQVSPEMRQSVEAVCAQFESWLDDATWANGYADDPWMDWQPARTAFEQSIQLREAAKEDAGRIPSTSYRTLWSKSVMTIEYHPFHCVFVLRYTPVAIPLPEKMLANLGDGIPAGMPLDLVASLLREGNITLGLLDAIAEKWEPWQTVARLALQPGEPTASVELRARFDQIKEDSQTRVLFTQLALHYQHDWVLFDIASAEPELVRQPDLAPHFRRVIPEFFFEVPK